jgi:hypothetical protein
MTTSVGEFGLMRCSMSLLTLFASIAVVSGHSPTHKTYLLITT